MKNSLTLITVIQTIYKFIMNSVAFYWAIYFASIGLSGSQIGLLFAVVTITGLLVTLPTGLSNDRITSKHIIQIGLTLLIIEMALLSQTQHFPLMLILFFIGGLGGNLHGISIDSLFYKTSGEESPTHRIKTYVSYSLLGAGLGAIFSGNLLGYIDFQKYLIIICGMLVTLLILSTFLPNTDTWKFDTKTYGRDIWRPHVLLFMAIIFSFAIHMGSEFTSYGPFLKEVLGLSFPQMGLYIGSAIVFMFISVRIANRMIENGVKMRKIVTIGLLMSGIGYLVMLYPAVAISFIGRAVHEAGDAFMFVFLYTGVGQFFKKERIGGNSGLITLTQTSAMALGSFAFGPLGEAYGHQIPIIIGAITTLLAIILLKAYEHYINRYEG